MVSTVSASTPALSKDKAGQDQKSSRQERRQTQQGSRSVVAYIQLPLFIAIASLVSDVFVRQQAHFNTVGEAIGVSFSPPSTLLVLNQMLTAVNTDKEDGANSSEVAHVQVVQEEKKWGPAIVCLVANLVDDYVRLQAAITTLNAVLEDNQALPLLLFNEGNLPLKRQQWLRALTNQQVNFPVVNFQEFPASFDKQRKKKRDKR